MAEYTPVTSSLIPPITAASVSILRIWRPAFIEDLLADLVDRVAFCMTFKASRPCLWSAAARAYSSRSNFFSSSVPSYLTIWVSVRMPSISMNPSSGSLVLKVALPALLISFANYLRWLLPPLSVALRLLDDVSPNGSSLSESAFCTLMAWTIFLTKSFINNI